LLLGNSHRIPLFTLNLSLKSGLNQLLQLKAVTECKQIFILDALWMPLPKEKQSRKKSE
jgi:hypothetical protein